MRGNDISNKTAPILAFNADKLLFVNKDAKKGLKGFIDNIAVQFKADYEIYLDRELNKVTTNLLEKLWTNENVSIHLVTFRPFSDAIEDYLREKDVRFTRLHEVKDLNEFIVKVRDSYLYYFDNDDSFLSILGCKNALNISDIKKVI